MRFPEVGEKRLLLAWAPLEKVVTRLARCCSNAVPTGRACACPSRPHARDAARAARRRARRSHRPGRGGRRRAARSRSPRRPHAGRPVGRRHRRPGRAGRASWWWPRPTATSSCCCASPSPGPARIPVPVNAQMRPDEIDHVESDSGAALVVRAVPRPADGAEPLGRRASRPSPTTSPRSSTRRAPPASPRASSSPTRACSAALTAGALPARRHPPRRGGGQPADRPHHGLRRRARAGVRRHPRVLPAPLPPGARCSTPSSAGGPAIFIGVPAMYRMLLEAGAEDRDLKSVRVWVSGADAMPADLAARFKKLGATATLPVVGAGGEAVFVEGYGMVEIGGGVAAKVSPPMLGRGLGVVAGHARCPATVQGGRRRRRRGPPRAWSASCSVKGPGRHPRLLGRRRGHRGHAHRRRLAAHRRPRPARAARQRRVLRRPQEGRDQARRLLGVRGRGRAGARAAPRRASRPRCVGLPDERKGEVPAAVVRLADGRDARRGGHAAWADERLSDYKAPRPHRRRRRAAPHRHQQGPAQGAARALRLTRASRRSWRPGTIARDRSSRRSRRDVARVVGFGRRVVVVVRAAALRSTSSLPFSTRTG